MNYAGGTKVPEPVTTIDRPSRIIQNRFATSDPALFLDVMVTYNNGERVFTSWVRRVEHHEGGGESFSHIRDAEKAGHATYRSQTVGRYSEKTHIASARLALLAFTPKLPALIEWAEAAR